LVADAGLPAAAGEIENRGGWDIPIALYKAAGLMLKLTAYLSKRHTTTPFLSPPFSFGLRLALLRLYVVSTVRCEVTHGTTLSHLPQRSLLMGGTVTCPRSSYTMFFAETGNLKRNYTVKRLKGSRSTRRHMDEGGKREGEVCVVPRQIVPA
jgi:hypothetical protein